MLGFLDLSPNIPLIFLLSLCLGRSSGSACSLCYSVLLNGFSSSYSVLIFREKEEIRLNKDHFLCYFGNLYFYLISLSLFDWLLFPIFYHLFPLITSSSLYYRRVNSHQTIGYEASSLVLSTREPGLKSRAKLIRA